MNPKKPKPLCKNCGQVLKRTSSSYCSQGCQHEFSRKTFIFKWRSGEISGTTADGTISDHIRSWMFEKRNHCCEICGWSEIKLSTGKVPLEIHHVDGDADNNREENLQLLCPNCHTLADDSPRRKEQSKRMKYYRSSIAKTNASNSMAE